MIGNATFCKVFVYYGKCEGLAARIDTSASNDDRACRTPFRVVCTIADSIIYIWCKQHAVIKDEEGWMYGIRPVIDLRWN